MITIYLRRNGGMVFWRVGRIGGSFYLSQSRHADNTERAQRRAKRKAMRRELSRLRMERYRQLQSNY